MGKTPTTRWAGAGGRPSGRPGPWAGPPKRSCSLPKGKTRESRTHHAHRRRHTDEGRPYMATHESFHPTRRHFLQGAGAVTAALALSPRRPASAQAASRIVLGTWGGDYSKLLTKNVEAHLAPR